MISQDELQKLISAKIITIEQGQKIFAFQQQQTTAQDNLSGIQIHKFSFSFAKTLYYLGGFLIVFAISYILGTNWESLGDFGRIAAALNLMILFGGLGIYLKNTPYKIASSLLLLAGTIAVPLLIYSIERAIGWWPPVNQYSGSLTYKNFLDRINTAWVVLDILTVIISLVIFYTFKNPILSLPIAHFFWFLVLDTTNLITGTHGSENLVLKSWLSILAGAILIGWGIYYHSRKDNRVGVWPWLYGLAIILGSLIALRFDTEEGIKLLYQVLILAFGLVTLFTATPLRSKTFLVFGALGIFWFIQDISWTYFQDSLGFSVVLIISGLLTIGFGILVQQYYKKQFVVE